MARGNTRPNYFGSRMLMAYAVAYAIAIGGVVLGIVLRSVPWLAFGIWLAASLTVLLIDRAVVVRTPRQGNEATESLGALFQGSPAALVVIAVMAVAALVVSFFAYW
jgi:hypothetical protein